jgi:hypothetical protein
VLREFGGMVIFDHEDAVGIGEHLAQPVGTAGRDRCAGRVLRPAGHDDRGDAD